MLVYGLGLAMLLCLPLVCHGATDLTREDGASGEFVVDATLDQIEWTCIFTPDYLMMKRLAWVETEYGDLMAEGGIWKASLAMFEKVQDAVVSLNYQSLFDAIDAELDVDISGLDYDDLSTPIYSALVARVYLHLVQEVIVSIPYSIDDQGLLWEYYYNSTTAPKSTAEFVEKVTGLFEGCVIHKADIVFVMDGSGSIEWDNFILMKLFVQGIVMSTAVGEDLVRVGLIRFSTYADVIFDLGQHNTTTDVIDAVGDIEYLGGWTSSYLAIEETLEMFTRNPRRESGIPQICIFLTDGQSNNVSLTAEAAAELHSSDDVDITVFAIGVAEAMQSELETIGSEPSCIFVNLMQKFEDMAHFSVQLEKQACSVPIILEIGDELEGNCNEAIHFTVPVQRNERGVTITLVMPSGSGHLYTSFTVRTPNPALHDLHIQVDSSDRNGDTLEIRFPDDLVGMNETHVFLSLYGDGIGEDNLFNIMFEDGLNGTPGLKMMSMYLLLACVLAVFLNEG